MSALSIAPFFCLLITCLKAPSMYGRLATSRISLASQFATDSTLYAPALYREILTCISSRNFCFLPLVVFFPLSSNKLHLHDVHIDAHYFIHFLFVCFLFIDYDLRRPGIAGTHQPACRPHQPPQKPTGRHLLGTLARLQPPDICPTRARRRRRLPREEAGSLPKPNSRSEWLWIWVWFRIRILE